MVVRFNQRYKISIKYFESFFFALPGKCWLCSKEGQYYFFNSHLFDFLSNTFTLSICPLACKPRHISGCGPSDSWKYVCVLAGYIYLYLSL